MSSGVFVFLGVVLGAAFSFAGVLLQARISRAAELEKIKQQAEVQQTALEREKIAEMRRRYLIPLRYYALTLSYRLGELEDKFKSSEVEKVRGWLERAKNYVEDSSWDEHIDKYEKWFYYEGIFAESTLYYTCSYFYYAREVRFSRPFDAIRNVYAEELGRLLDGVTKAFWRNDTEHGLWDTAQEMIGERFGKSGSAMTFVEMLQEHQAAEPFRRAVFLRPLDFYKDEHLDVGWAREIKTSLDKLVRFLDPNKNDPQNYRIPVQQERNTNSISRNSSVT